MTAYFNQKPRIRFNDFDGFWICYTGPSGPRAEGSMGFGPNPSQAYANWHSEELFRQRGSISEVLPSGRVVRCR